MKIKKRITAIIAGIFLAGSFASLNTQIASAGQDDFIIPYYNDPRRKVLWGEGSGLVSHIRPPSAHLLRFTQREEGLRV